MIGFIGEVVLLCGYELDSLHPDILILQNVMNRSESAQDSDIAILSAGALNDYRWDRVKVKEHPQTDQEEASVVGVMGYLGFASTSNERSSRWDLEGGGTLTLHRVVARQRPVFIFNVSLARQVECGLVFDRIANIVNEVMKMQASVRTGSYWQVFLTDAEPKKTIV